MQQQQQLPLQLRYPPKQVRRRRKLKYDQKLFLQSNPNAMVSPHSLEWNRNIAFVLLSSADKRYILIGFLFTPVQLQRQATDNTKEKCRRFLANLLELSSREPRQVERSVRTLIQELIDVRVEPEEFCVRLETLLNASPQPCLIGFLKKSLPLLRQSLVTKELVIEGIRPPPANVVFSIATVVTTVTQVIDLFFVWYHEFSS